MNISINVSSFPFTVKFQRRIWMHYIYTISKLYKASDNYQEKFELISVIQKNLNVTSKDDGVDSILSTDINKIQLSILNTSSTGIGIGDDKEWEKSWNDSCELVISTFKQFKEV